MYNSIYGYNNMSNGNNDSCGVLVIKTDISDYLNKIYTLNGKYPNGITINAVYKSIVANNVVSNHLYRLFNPLESNIDKFNVVNNILDNLSIKSVQIDEIGIDLIMVMLENEIKKILKHVFKFTDYQINSLDKLSIILDSIKNDLLFIKSNL